MALTIDSFFPDRMMREGWKVFLEISSFINSVKLFDSSDIANLRRRIDQDYLSIQIRTYTKTVTIREIRDVDSFTSFDCLEMSDPYHLSSFDCLDFNLELHFRTLGTSLFKFSAAISQSLLNPTFY